MTPHEASKLEIMLGAIEADLTIARQNVAETTETIDRMTNTAALMLAQTQAGIEEAARREIAFNHARYGQTGEG